MTPKITNASVDPMGFIKNSLNVERYTRAVFALGEEIILSYELRVNAASVELK